MNRQPGVLMVNVEESRADVEAAKAFVQEIYRAHANNTSKDGLAAARALRYAESEPWTSPTKVAPSTTSCP